MQDQDNPSSYSNHTCEVRGSYHKRQHEDSDSSEPKKRLRASDSETSSFDKAAAQQERQTSHHNTNISGARHLDEPRINPIDHIFQFHKVQSCSPSFPRVQIGLFRAHFLMYMCIASSEQRISYDDY